MLEIKNPNKKAQKAYNAKSRSTMMMPKSYTFKDRHEKRQRQNAKELFNLKREYVR